MEVKDLMIGDWFIFLIDMAEGDTEYDHKNEIIYQPKQVEHIEFGDAITEGGVTNEPRQLQPIPITAKILGKNFKSTELPDDPYGAYFFGGDDKIKIYIREHTDGLWKVDVDEIEIGGIRSWRMYVRYVHELQHTLILCNIEKDIKL